MDERERYYEERVRKWKEAGNKELMKIYECLLWNYRIEREGRERVKRHKRES